jgi:arylsulfatase A-like enzyme
MNLLFVVSDTLRWDYLGAYGNTWIETPNLDRLAAESLVFEDAYAEGLPTLPARRVMQTGRPIVPFKYVPQKSDMVQCHGWHGVFDEDVTAAEWLGEHGYVSCLVTDVYHMMKPGKNFHRGFDCWYWIRGEEDDRFALRDEAQVADLLAKAAPGAQFRSRHWLTQHLMNRKDWAGDADTYVGQVMRKAADWLEAYTLDAPFYMWVDCFDPHEPWDPPVDYARRYDPSFDSLDGLVPPGLTSNMTEAQVRNTLTAYAGEVTLVDRWVGHLLDTLQVTGKLDDTVIVFTSDHGCMLGEQGEMHKGVTRLRNQCTRLPLFIRHPQGAGAGRRVRGFVQHTDMLPTALALLGLPQHERMLGRNAWPAAVNPSLRTLASAEGGVGPQGRGWDAVALRDYTVTAFGGYASYRTDRWNYVTAWDAEVQNPRPPELYDLQADPQELTSVAADHPEVTAALREALQDHLRAHAPLTQGHLGGTADMDVLGEMGVKMSFDALPSLK